MELKVGQVYKVDNRDIVKIISIETRSAGYNNIKFLYIKKSTETIWGSTSREWLENDFLKCSKLLKGYNSKLYKVLND